MDVQQSASSYGTPPSDAEVQAFLIARFGREVSEVSRVGHGEWSKAYCFCSAGGAYVARFSKLVEDFAKDRLAARYGSPDLPIPRIVEIGEAFGGFYCVTERAFGDYLDALDGRRMREVLPSLFATLDAMRRVDLPDSSGYGGWGADGLAMHPTWQAALLDVAEDRPSSRTHGWRACLAVSPTGLEPFERSLERLRALVGYTPSERHLIHSDLLNYNVLVSGNRISAVIDWGCSLYGDFLYDVAWLSFWSPWYPAWRGIDFAREFAQRYQAIGLDAPNFMERLRCYELHIGLAGLAYSAFRGRWSELEATARRTLDLL